MKKDIENKFNLDNTDGTEYPEEVKKKSNKNHYVPVVVALIIITICVVFFVSN